MRCASRRALSSNPQVKQSSLENRDQGQILKTGSNYQDEEWEEGLRRQNERWMQITLLKSDYDAFPSKSCAFSDVSWPSLIHSPTHVHFHLDSPSQAKASCVPIPTFQKGWAKLNSSLSFNYNLKGSTKRSLFHLLGVYLSLYFFFISSNIYLFKCHFLFNLDNSQFLLDNCLPFKFSNCWQLW